MPRRPLATLVGVAKGEGVVGATTRRCPSEARRGRQLVVVVTAAALVATGGCSARRGVYQHGIYHEVAADENLYRIGKAYGIPFQQLSRINNIDDPDRIRVGQRLFIPGATRRLPVRIITPDRAQSDRPGSGELPAGSQRFIWPVAGGRVTSGFGPRGDTFHDGIDIAVPNGTPVYAARAGEVLYSDKLRGYGNVIILRHDEGYASVYAHNSTHLVEVGTRVRRRQMIARVGETGRASGPNLHFEVRKGNVARNPLFYLPPARELAAREDGS